MNNLIPLASIPLPARRVECATRKAYSSCSAARAAAQYRIDVAPGCHSRPSFDPPVLGWVLTRDAAVAITEQLTRMLDGTSHRRTSCEQLK